MATIVNSSNIEQPNARRVILNLLGVTDDGTLSVAEAINACALFGITDNSVRVTLARLSQSKLIETTDRGIYRLGEAWQNIASDVAGWRNAEERLVQWEGKWVLAAIGTLPRSDRKILRNRQRALSMLGMKELATGLFIRPDNLVGGVVAVRQRLISLGLEDDAIIFRADEFDEDRQNRAAKLWNGDALAASYKQNIARLEEWAKNEAVLPFDIAAQESFILGDNAIREIVFDPMLPAPLVDEEQRRHFFKTMVHFDELGRRIWLRFLNRPDGSAVS